MASRHDDTSVDTRTPGVDNSVPPFSKQEAAGVRERLANNETYREAMKILIAWLESGKCNKRNSSCFYSLIELCYSHVEKLKTDHEEYVKAMRRTGRSALNKSDFQDKVKEFLDVFNALESQTLWPHFRPNQVIKLNDMLVGLCNRDHNIQSDCVGDVFQVTMSDDVGIQVVPKECDIEEMKAKLPNLTKELNTVYRITSDMKAECVAFWNEWPAIAGPENEWPDIRLEMKNWRLQRTNSPVLDFKRLEKNPIHKFADKLGPNECERYYIAFVALFLNENPEGVDLYGIYAFTNKNFRHACPVEIETELKRFPQFFEKYVQPEAKLLLKKMRLS